jgi:hypothetical protein
LWNSPTQPYRSAFRSAAQKQECPCAARDGATSIKNGTALAEPSARISLSRRRRKKKEGDAVVRHGSNPADPFGDVVIGVNPPADGMRAHTLAPFRSDAFPPLNAECRWHFLLIVTNGAAQGLLSAGLIFAMWHTGDRLAGGLFTLDVATWATGLIVIVGFLAILRAAQRQGAERCAAAYVGALRQQLVAHFATAPVADSGPRREHEIVSRFAAELAAIHDGVSHGLCAATAGSLAAALCLTTLLMVDLPLAILSLVFPAAAVLAFAEAPPGRRRVSQQLDGRRTRQLWLTRLRAGAFPPPVPEFAAGFAASAAVLLALSSNLGWLTPGALTAAVGAVVVLLNPLQALAASRRPRRGLRQARARIAAVLVVAEQPLSGIDAAAASSARIERP